MSDIYPIIAKASPTSHAADVYYFSHIPKTGGTSFTAILDRFFDADDIYGPQLWWDVGNIEEVRKQNYKCIRGHFGMGAQALSNNKLQTLTILRDPLRMAYSTYQYVKREPNTAVNKYVTENQLSFEAFLQDPKTRNLTKNRMMKSLSFGLGLLPAQQDLVVTPENYKFCRKQWNKELKKMAPDRVLELVKTYLDRCFWVGILEDFELSLMMLCHQMSWPAIGTTEKLNRHPNQPKISDQAVSLVKEMNLYDYELYEYAKHLFNQKVKTTFKGLGFHGKDTKEAKNIVDSNYQKNHTEQNKTALPVFIKYEFSMPLLGQNWHAREWNDTAYFRWTGPGGITTVDFWLKPQDYMVNLEFVNLIDDNLLNSLVIQANGSAVDWNVKVDGRTGVILFLCKESSIQQNGLLRLKMITENLNTHHSVFNSNDNRRVGFAMKSITIQKQGHVNS